jgi:hypothetical protein
MSTSRFYVVALTFLSLTVPPSASAQNVAATHHPAQVAATGSAFIEKVREATEVFRDVGNAGPDYAQILGCVSGPEEGAMGVHFLNPGLAFDAEVKAEKPEALIYEFTGGVARLVGVEYIVLASAWHQTHAPQDPPVLEGQLLHFNSSPNRFGLPDFYELHVWAWRDNPRGEFSDFNPRVTCAGQ